MMDSFSEYLFQKYSEVTLDNPNHFKTIIIQKVVRMFHTFNSLVKESQDEVSIRCVLRGLLDNVIVYSFIYEREDEEDVLFRHYLYALDGFESYKKHVIVLLEKGNNTITNDSVCDEIIYQIERKLYSHPYMNLNKKVIENIINNNNWKYESIKHPKSLSYLDMYIHVGFEGKLANYYQCYSSQFSHGLCISNHLCVDNEMMKMVLFESIPIEDRMVRAILNTFPKNELTIHFLSSKQHTELLNDPNIDYDEIIEFVNAIVKGDRELII